MGCTPSMQISPTRGLCMGAEDDQSPPCSSNHLLTGVGTTHPVPQRPDREKCYILAGHTTRYQVLLVFPKEDGVCEAWSWCCRKQGHEVVTAASVDDVLKVHLEQNFDLAIVDARLHKYSQAVEIAEAVKGVEGAASCVLAALVKKNSLERDSAKINTLLNNGFNRILMETTNRQATLIDLLQIERNELMVQHQLRALSAAFTALDTCKDLVHITDTQHKIQYVNRACKTQLGYTLDELSGKTIWEVHGSDHHRQDLKTPTGSDHHQTLDPLRSVESLTSQPSSIHRPPAHVLKGSDLREIKESKVSLDISEAVNLQMRRGKEWEGVVSCRRKSGDIINVSSRVVPVLLHARRSDFYVYVGDSHPHQSEHRFSDHHHPRGSVKSLRKGSYDIRSLNSDEGSLGTTEFYGGIMSAPVQRDKFTFNRHSTRFDGFREGSIIRRQSVAKLHSVMMETPINKVINIITAAQNSSPAYIAQGLDKVLEILRSTELYNPQPISDNLSKSVTSADPVATDLLGGLLSRAPKPLSTGRRSSSSDQGMKIIMTSNPRPSLPHNFHQASGAIRELLETNLSWDFDIFKLEALSDKRPLVWVGMSLMCQMDVPSSLGCDEQTLQNWLTLIEANYQSTNSYHNSTHAADVLQTTAYFLQTERLKKHLDPLEVAACLIAAVAHDVDHPGKNSQFLCNTNNQLAILYNDTCVLESHHAAVTFKLTFSDERVNILKGLDQENYQFMRKNIIDMILATDMAKHFEHVNKFINMIEKCVQVDNEEQEAVETLDLSLISTPENMQIIKRMLIKCADISNPLRPIHLCKDWANRIANEYFSQTEEEKRRKIPVVMPQFDRHTCSIPKSQIGFIDFFIFDMFEAWHELVEIPCPMEHLQQNYRYWKDQEILEQVKKEKGNGQSVQSPSSETAALDSVTPVVAGEIS